MPVDLLQHINIRTADVEQSRDFYVQILGLRVGDRPQFTSTGYWMYLGDQPVIHLVQCKDDEKPGAGTGAVDHIAFRGLDLATSRKTLESAGLPFREAIVPRDNTVQLFVHDPDGVKIELNFEGL